MTNSLEYHQVRERELLAEANRKPQSRRYILNRSWLAVNFLAVNYYLPQEPKILEVGMGTGENLKRIVRENSQIQLRHCTGTCLQILPEHEILQSNGLAVVPDTLIEDLPNVWNGRFDVVMASLVLYWADNKKSAINRLSEVTASDGYLLCFDTPGLVRQLVELTSNNFTSIEPRIGFIEEYHGVILHKGNHS